MNDFKNQNNMNDNYNQNCGHNNGEYYYSYTPNNTSHRQRRAGKYIFIAIMSVILVVLVVFSGVLIGALTFTVYSNYKRCEISKVEGDGNSVRVSSVDEALTESLTEASNEENTTIYGIDAVDHGIRALDVTQKNLHCYYKYGITEIGVIVADSAYTDKLMLGDRIISVNGKQIFFTEDIEPALEGCCVGEVVEIVAERDGKEFTVKITLREQMPDYVDFG